jgi:ABC-type Fe3+-siderophore transport system permease subunit
VTAVFLGLTPLILFRSVFALAGSAAVSFFVFLLGKKRSGFSIQTAILAGVGFNALFTSLILLLQSLLLPNDLQSSITWLTGRMTLPLPSN